MILVYTHWRCHVGLKHIQFVAIMILRLSWLSTRKQSFVFCIQTWLTCSEKGLLLWAFHIHRELNATAMPGAWLNYYDALPEIQEIVISKKSAGFKLVTLHMQRDAGERTSCKSSKVLYIQKPTLPTFLYLRKKMEPNMRSMC